MLCIISQMDEWRNMDWKKIDWKKNIRKNMPNLLHEIETNNLEGFMRSNEVLLPIMIKRIWVKLKLGLFLNIFCYILAMQAVTIKLVHILLYKRILFLFFLNFSG